MIRLIFCVRRRPDLELHAFRRDWVEPMRAVAAELAAASGARRHELSVTLELPENEQFVARQGFAAPFDAVMELEFDDGTTVRSALASDAVEALRARMRQLAASYLDVAGSSVFFTQDLASL